MTARIFKPAKNAMQSGTAKTRDWQLDYEPEQPRAIEPLMGWTSSGDMKQQLTIRFDTREDAVAYCEREGIPYPKYREDVRNEITIARLRDREVDSRTTVSDAEVDNFLATAAAQTGGEHQQQPDQQDTGEVGAQQGLLGVGHHGGRTEPAAGAKESMHRIRRWRWNAACAWTEDNRSGLPLAQPTNR